MRVWITGAGGFLGTNLVSCLLRNSEFEIIALTSGGEKLLQMFPEEKRLTVENRDALSRVPDGALSEDILVCCAYPRNTDGPKIAEGLAYIKDTLFDAHRTGFRGVINISSQSVYSASRTSAADEKAQVSVESVYAAGKLASELLTELSSGGRPYTNVRMASLIGPGFDARLTNKLVKNAASGGELRIKGSGQIFGFLDVEDAAKGIMSLIQTDPLKWKPVYNLGVKKGYTLTEIAGTVRDVMQKEYGIDVSVSEEPGEAVSDTTLDSSLLEKDTGFSASVTLYESIRRIARRIMNSYGN